jgi:hypothetical protein
MCVTLNHIQGEFGAFGHVKKEGRCYLSATVASRVLWIFYQLPIFENGELLGLTSMISLNLWVSAKILGPFNCHARGNSL